MTRKRTSVQLAGVGLVFFHDLPDLVSLQRRVQHLVQPGVSLPTVDEFHELVQGDEGLPLGAAAAERKAAFRTLEELRSECKREGGKKKGRWMTFPQRCFGSQAGGRGCPGISGRPPK